MRTTHITRREALAAGAALAGKALAGSGMPQEAGSFTKFQIGCMTLPYAPFPFERALRGIKEAGCQYVGWGTTHREAGGERVPVLPVDAPPAQAAKLAERTRSFGLEPVMMFSGINVEAADAVKLHTRRIEQAAAAKIPFLLTFGKTKPGEYDAWIRTLKQLGPVARSSGVMIVIKQHGGETGTGRACSKILADVADPGVQMCYDAGNVLDYESVDPIPDIQACWRDIRAFAIKDHRKTPKNEDCGPGFGEIDHYKLLTPVLRTGFNMPLICENIFEPLLPRPTAPEGVDALARRAREFLEVVVKGLQRT